MPDFVVEIIDEGGKTNVKVTFPQDYTWQKIDALMDALDCSEEMRNVCLISENGNSTKIIPPKGDGKTAVLVFERCVTSQDKNNLADAGLPTSDMPGKMPFIFSTANISRLLEKIEHKYYPPSTSPKPPEKKGSQKRRWF